MQPGAGHRGPCGPAPDGARQAVQLRCRVLPRAAAGSGSQNVPANYGEFYEKRQFTPGSTEVEWVNVCGQDVPFGTSLLFRCRQMPSFVLGVELCEDLWSALPPSTFHALAGATVIANLSASDETVGKAEYRRALVENQSARLLCGYLYASAGHGESTQDMVFAGHDLIAENGTLLAEVKPFAGGLAETELDCQRMELERARNTSFEPSTEATRPWSST